jgi:hypothetical protein
MKNVVDSFERLKYCPFEIKRIQRDNDKDFDVAAHAYLKKNKLIHFVGTIPPKTRKQCPYTKI